VRRSAIATLTLALGIAFGPASAGRADDGPARADMAGANALGPEPALGAEALAEQRAQGLPGGVSIGEQVPRWPAVILWDEVRQGRPKTAELVQIKHAGR
jgi:hypothetical protein